MKNQMMRRFLALLIGMAMLLGCCLAEETGAPAEQPSIAFFNT